MAMVLHGSSAPLPPPLSLRYAVLSGAVRDTLQEKLIGHACGAIARRRTPRPAEGWVTLNSCRRDTQRAISCRTRVCKVAGTQHACPEFVAGLQSVCMNVTSTARGNPGHRFGEGRWPQTCLEGREGGEITTGCSSRPGQAAEPKIPVTES